MLPKTYVRVSSVNADTVRTYEQKEMVTFTVGELLGWLDMDLDKAGDETGLRGKWLPEDPTLRQKVHGDYTDQFPKPRLTGNHSAFRPCRAVLVFLSRQSIETRVHSKHAPRCEGADTVLEGHRTLREAVVLQKTSPAVIKGVSAWSSSRAFRSSRTVARLLDQPTRRKHHCGQSLGSWGALFGNIGCDYVRVCVCVRVFLNQA